MREGRTVPRRWVTADTAFDLAVLVFATVGSFWPVLHNGFVNWDDPSVLVDNAHLRDPGVLPWAFSTTVMGHYQPLAWIVWSLIVPDTGPSAAAIHGASVAVHLANGIVLYVLTLHITANSPLGARQRRAAGLLVALLFLVHPISVETVAWASAFPYVLSLLGLLLSFLAYMNRRLALSIALYAASLLTRATALGYPLVLIAIDLWQMDRRPRASLRRSLAEKAPFFVLAAAAAAAEWRARDVASLQDIGLGPRVTMAAAAPLVYLWRTLWPPHLSPLNPLEIAPVFEASALLAGAAGLIVLSALTWSVRARWPAVPVAWVAYLILLAPVAGLTPSGVQATADRYMYVPAVVAAMLTGIAVGSQLTSRRRTTVALVAAAGIIATFSVLTFRQGRYWSNSITLWTRAAELDPRNDIATYNLAVALAEAHRDEEATAWYERTLALVPDHDLARRNLTILQAAAAERNADRLATEGRADEASEEYAHAVALDPERLHARAAHGMLLLQRGKLNEAASELRIAMDGGINDVAVPNALAFALVQLGDAAQAAGVLTHAVADHPDDVNLKHNLARLLATTPDPRVRDGRRALQLASEVCDRTGNRDARALDTLSAAYAATGHMDLARATAAKAARRARELGDSATAAEIEAHARSYAGR